MKTRLMLTFMVGLLFFFTSCKSAQSITSNPMTTPIQASQTPTFLPSSTPKPTATATPALKLYSVTFGYCKTNHALSGDPTRLKECVVKEKKQMELTSGQTVRYSTLLAHQFASFCAIHQTDGKFIIAFVDSQKFGEALCVLP